MAADVYGLTAGRAWSLVGAVLGLAGVGFGVFARRRGVVAVACGVAGASIGLVVVVMAKGGPGTGYGIVGGYLSLVVGVIAVVLGALARRRAARAAAPRVS